MWLLKGFQRKSKCYRGTAGVNFSILPFKMPSGTIITVGAQCQGLPSLKKGTLVTLCFGAVQQKRYPRDLKVFGGP